MAAELKIGIGADNSGLKQGLQDAEAQIQDFFKKVGKLSEIGDRISGIGQKLTVGLTLPIVGLGAGAIKAYGDIQSLQKGLEAVMGSAGSASKEFERLKEVSRLPGLGMEEAVRGSINLQAIGIDADKSRKILSQFGNAVASVGKGKAEFERAIYGVQQLANTDFPLGEDLNIIKDALPQVSNLLKEAFGSSRSDELAKMGVSSQQVLDTITKGLEKLPRVTGGINGAFENLGDSMKTSLARIGKIIDDTFDISGIIDKLTGYLDTAISYFEGLSPAVQQSILVVAGLVAAAGPLLIVIGGIIQAIPVLIAGIGGVGVAFTALTGPIGLVVVGIGAIIAAVVSNWDKIKPYITKTIQWFVDIYNESKIVRIGIEALVANFKVGFSIVANILKTAYELIKSFAKGVADAFGGVGSVIKGVLTGDFEAIKNGVRQIAGAVTGTLGNYYNDIKNGLKSTFTDISKIANDGISRVMGGKISAPKLFDEDEVANKTEKTVKKGIEKGLKKVTDKKITVDLPEIEVLPGAAKGLSNGLGEYFDTPLDFDNWFSGLTDGLNSLDGKVKAVVTESIIPTFTQLNEDINALIQDSIGPSIFNAFDAVGQAIGSGGNVIGAFANSVLSSLGSFLSQMGQMLIKYGVLAVTKGKLDLAIAAGGPISIGAGIAAIAVGALLSVAGAALGSFASSGGSGGGGSVPSGGGGSQSYSSSFSGGGGTGGGEVVFRIAGNDLVGVLSRQQDKNTRIGG